MSELSSEEILHLIISKQWFHAFEIAPGIITPGKARVEPRVSLDIYGVPEDLSGKTALDVGAGDGAYAFEQEWLKASGFNDISVSKPLNKKYSRAGGHARKDTGFSPYEHGLV